MRTLTLELASVRKQIALKQPDRAKALDRVLAAVEPLVADLVELRKNFDRHGARSRDLAETGAKKPDDKSQPKRCFDVPPGCLQSSDWPKKRR